MAQFNQQYIFSFRKFRLHLCLFFLIRAFSVRRLKSTIFLVVTTFKHKLEIQLSKLKEAYCPKHVQSSQNHPRPKVNKSLQTFKKPKNLIFHLTRQTRKFLLHKFPHNFIIKARFQRGKQKISPTTQKKKHNDHMNIILF